MDAKVTASSVDARRAALEVLASVEDAHRALTAMLFAWEKADRAGLNLNEVPSCADFPFSELELQTLAVASYVAALRQDLGVTG